jgi:malonate transporter
VVIFAATPTGANAYLFANHHGRAMNSASGAVALGTALSVITASILLANLASR